VQPSSPHLQKQLLVVDEKTRTEWARAHGASGKRP
jgi:hypothetical protein